MPDLLIDTNLLVLYVVGTWNRQQIPRIKRTSIFTSTDFDTLLAETARYRAIITVPAVLTEVSDLMGNEFHQVIAPTIEEVGRSLQERSPSKDQVLADDVFDRLGFADISILLASDQTTTVLTDDVLLYSEALYRGLDAVNFNHLRKIR